MKYFKNLKLKLKNHFKEILRIKSSPYSIALGFSIGTFISLLPTPGFNILLCILVTILFNKVSKIALFSTLVIWNPITQAPIYAINYSLGNFILGDLETIIFKVQNFQQVYEYTLRYLVGSFITATIISIVMFFIIYFITSKIQKNAKIKNLK
jgi:uncharacterized protein